MRKGLAVVAIIAGAIGVLPLALQVTMQAGLLVPAAIYEPVWWLYDHISEPVQAVIALLVAPTLLLWGLITVQRTARGRGLVTIGAIAVCIATAPFGYGLILCIPLLLCVVLPIMRQYKAARGASSTAPSA